MLEVEETPSSGGKAFQSERSRSLNSGCSDGRFHKCMFLVREYEMMSERSGRLVRHDDVKTKEGCTRTVLARQEGSIRKSKGEGLLDQPVLQAAGLGGAA